MLTEKENKEFESVGFRFKGEHQDHTVGIFSLGWNEVFSPTYNWNGLTRSEIGKCIFQYTLSGQGMITIEGKEHTLSAGEAFLVQIPSNHSYFLPEESEQWEFIYISLYGKEAQKAFEFITGKMGHVINFLPESAPIKQLRKIYQNAVNQEITDAYQSSALGYSFLMELYRIALNISEPFDNLPEQVSKAIIFIQKQYNQFISLDDIVEASTLSKYHFTRLFHKTTNMTPLQYLTKIRIDNAIELLRFTNLSIEDISRQVGYSNGNYFCKVFSKRVNMSPGQFRQSKNTVPVDHILTD